MPSYTTLTVISTILVLILDLCMTRFVLRKKFWVFYFLVVILHTIVDNYLNGRWFSNIGIVWKYQELSGIKIWHTPLENYFFGWSLVILNLINFELLKRKFGKRKLKKILAKIKKLINLTK